MAVCAVARTRRGESPRPEEARALKRAKKELVARIEARPDAELAAALEHPQADPGVLADWAIEEAARLFRLEFPEHAARLSPDDWRKAMQAWDRSRGKRPKGDKGPSKWKALAKFVKLAGFEPVSAKSLKDEWSRWKKGVISRRLFTDVPADNT